MLEVLIVCHNISVQQCTNSTSTCCPRLCLFLHRPVASRATGLDVLQIRRLLSCSFICFLIAEINEIFAFYILATIEIQFILLTLATWSIFEYHSSFNLH